jgi:hypothetical protein
MILTVTVVVQGVDFTATVVVRRVLIFTPSVVVQGVDIYRNCCCAGCLFLTQLLLCRVLILNIVVCGVFHTLIVVMQGVDSYRNCCCAGF